MQEKGGSGDEIKIFRIKKGRTRHSEGAKGKGDEVKRKEKRRRGEEGKKGGGVTLLSEGFLTVKGVVRLRVRRPRTRE